MSKFSFKRLGVIGPKVIKASEPFTMRELAAWAKAQGLSYFSGVELSLSARSGWNKTIGFLDTRFSRSTPNLLTREDADAGFGIRLSGQNYLGRYRNLRFIRDSKDDNKNIERLYSTEGISDWGTKD